MITLDQCFANYETEETLTGNDQFYCRACKEHRDINKKLELYRVPDIMVLQLRRFTQRKGVGSGGGMMGLAMAQIVG